MPVGRWGTRWVRDLYAAGSASTKAGVVILAVFGFFLYVASALWFDIAYWVIGWFGAEAVGPRARAGASLAAAALMVTALGASGTAQPAPSASPRTGVDARQFMATGAAANTQGTPSTRLTESAAPTPTEQSTPTDAPTPTPTPPPTPTSAPTAKKTTAPVPLTVQITSLPASVSPNENATLDATTTAGATCRASVKYHSGTISTAAGLKLRPVADSLGKVSWTWKIGASTDAGTATATVSCSLGSRTGSARKTFQVT